MTHKTVEHRGNIPMKCVAIALGLMSGLAQAQDQTVEGAQKFIEGLAEEGGLTVTLPDNETEITIQYTYNGPYENISLKFDRDKISATKALSPCSTRFYVDLKVEGKFSHGYQGPNNNWEQRTISYFHPQSKNGTRKSVNFDIDWAKVPAVEKKGDTSISLSDSAGNQVLIAVASKDYATRLRYAMEFLRVKCDKKSATGF